MAGCPVESGNPPIPSLFVNQVEGESFRLDAFNHSDECFLGEPFHQFGFARINIDRARRNCHSAKPCATKQRIEPAADKSIPLLSGLYFDQTPNRKISVLTLGVTIVRTVVPFDYRYRSSRLQYAL